jgi:hypothetical protein
MKTFNELTPVQQEEAILRTATTLRELMEQKVILSDRPVTEANVRDIAEAAAETAFYTESGDMVIEGVA